MFELEGPSQGSTEEFSPSGSIVAAAAAAHAFLPVEEHGIRPTRALNVLNSKNIFRDQRKVPALVTSSSSSSDTSLYRVGAQCRFLEDD